MLALQRPAHGRLAGSCVLLLICAFARRSDDAAMAQTAVLASTRTAERLKTMRSLLAWELSACGSMSRISHPIGRVVSSREQDTRLPPADSAAAESAR